MALMAAPAILVGLFGVLFFHLLQIPVGGSWNLPDFSAAFILRHEQKWHRGGTKQVNEKTTTTHSIVAAAVTY